MAEVKSRQAEAYPTDTLFDGVSFGPKVFNRLKGRKKINTVALKWRFLAAVSPLGVTAHGSPTGPLQI
jgi:hypothetical protein